MEDYMWWYYDAVIVALFVLCIWNGSRKGVLKSLLGLGVCVISLLISYFASAPVSEYVYNQFFQERIQEYISNKPEINNFTNELHSQLELYGYDKLISSDVIYAVESGEIDSASIYDSVQQQTGIDSNLVRSGVEGAITSAFEQSNLELPEWVLKSLTENTKDISDNILKTATVALSNDAEQLAINLESTYIQPAVCIILRIFSFGLLFLLISCLLRCIIKLLLSFGADKTYSIIDIFVGGLIGAGKAMIYVWLIIKLVQFIVNQDSGLYPFFSDNIINKTVLFKALYQLL
ncbi:MAG: hypothetical protein IJZ64_06240 [Ruminococcus sp.]|nr:hypothetical protein [Ruminococcus sp.]